MTSAQSPRRYAAPMAGLLYLAGTVILIDQAAILAASIYPPSADSVQWRFGAMGMAAGRATPFLLGDVALLAAGLIGGHRVLLRALAAVHLVLAPLVLGGVALFALDTLEMRQLLPLEARRQAEAGAVRAAIALLVVSGYAVWSAVMVFRNTPRPPTVRSADRRIVLETHSGGG